MTNDRPLKASELARREMQRTMARSLTLPRGKPVTFDDFIPSGGCLQCGRTVYKLGFTGMTIYSCECPGLPQVVQSGERCPWCSLPRLEIGGVGNGNRPTRIAGCDCSDKRIIESVERLSGALLMLDYKMDEEAWANKIAACRLDLAHLMNEVISRRTQHG